MNYSLAFLCVVAGSLGPSGCSQDDTVGTGQGVFGDGTVSAAEACDDGDAIGDDGCTKSCTVARCGDGIVRAGLGS